MLIPIGHERGEVMRWPWVTLSLIAVTVVVFLWQGGAEHAWKRQADEILSEAAALADRYPTLEVPPTLAEVLEWVPNSEERELDPQALETIDPQEIVSRLFEAGRGDAPSRPQPADPPSAARERIVVLDQQWQTALTNRPAQRWGLPGENHGTVQLFTYAFLHAGWLHLIGNLLILYLAGPTLEDTWGRPLFLAFYLAAAAFAGFGWTTTLDSTIPCIGASGAVAGAMGAFLMRWWKVKIRFAYFFLLFFRPVFGTFEAPAYLMLPLWFLGQFVSATGTDSATGGVAFWAHVWGFVFGVGVAGMIRFVGVEERIRPKLEAAAGVSENRPLAAATEALDAGDLPKARLILERALVEQPGDRDIAAMAWDLAMRAGAPAEGAPVLIRLIGEELRAGEHELAIGHFSELRHGVPEATLPLALHVRVVEALAAGHHQALAEEEAERLLPGAIAPPLALRLARSVGEWNGGLAARIATRGLEGTEIDPEVRDALDELASAALAPAAVPDIPAGTVAPVELQVTIATLEQIAADRLVLQLADRRRVGLGFAKIHGMLAVAVADRNLVDLLLDPPEPIRTSARIARIELHPRQLAELRVDDPEAVIAAVAERLGIPAPRWTWCADEHAHAAAVGELARGFEGRD